MRSGKAASRLAQGILLFLAFAHAAPSAATVSFGTRHDVTLTNIPGSAYFADINGDGKSDLIFTSGSMQYGVMLGTTPAGGSAPSYSAATMFAPGFIISTLRVMDINGDGRPDVLLGKFSDLIVYIYLNTTPPGGGTPSFGAATQITFPAEVGDIQLADFNGDGKPDLFCSKSFSLSVAVALNTTPAGAAAPTFSTPAYFPVAGGGSSGLGVNSVLMDLNGDGLADIAAAATGSSIVSVMFSKTLPGDASPSFNPKVDYSVAGAVAGADMNGDGRPDLVMSDGGTGSVGTLHVLFNTTTPGSATPAFTLSGPITTKGFAYVVDMNGDGAPDLVEEDAVGDHISFGFNAIAPGSTTAAFTSSSLNLTTGTNPSVHIADVNGDGLPDLIAGSQNPSIFGFFINTSSTAHTPSFQAPAAATTTAPSALALADINGDGTTDYVVTDPADGMVDVMFNQTTTGDGTAAFGDVAAFGTGNSPTAVVIADLNGDGGKDLVVANQGDDDIEVLLGSGNAGATTPTFTAAGTFQTGTAPTGLAVADLNADGLVDAAVADSGSDDVSVLLNTTGPGSGAASFATAAPFPAGTAPSAIAIADLNGDGLPDLVTANSGSDDVSVLLNTTVLGAATPTFTTKADFNAGSAPAAVAIADLNGDGKPDIVTANNGDDSVSVLLNQTAAGAATASFGTEAPFSVDPGPVSLRILDVDGDGRPDIVVASQTGDSLSVLLNTTPAGGASPSFAAPISMPSGGSPTAVAAADLNGDGLVDIAAAVDGPDSLSVFLQQLQSPGLGSGSFSINVNSVGTGTLGGTTVYDLPLNYSVSTPPQHGTLTLNATTGAYSYTPTAVFVGSDSFVAIASTGRETSQPATLSITVKDLGAIAHTGVLTAQMNTLASGTLSIISAYTGQILTYQLQQQAAHGTVLITNTATGAFSYTPANGYVGNDYFRFNAVDAYGKLSTTATEGVEVMGVAATPHDGNVTTTVGATVSGTLSATPGYAGQALTFQVVQAPAHGTVTVINTASGAFKYKPSLNFKGTDTFTFRTVDSQGLSSANAVESVKIKDVAPKALNGTLSTKKNTAVSGKMGSQLGYAGQKLTFLVVTASPHGRVTYNNLTGSFSFQPTTGFTGTAVFKFNMKDSLGTVSNTATESITVHP